jgi:hypothetical protein
MRILRVVNVLAWALMWLMLGFLLTELLITVALIVLGGPTR